MTDRPEDRLLRAIFPDPKDNPLPDFNDLVREAFTAQETFDNWDNGKTFTGLGERACTLDEVGDEWSAANAKLIRYVMEHGERLLAMEEAGDLQ